MVKYGKMTYEQMKRRVSVVRIPLGLAKREYYTTGRRKAKLWMKAQGMKPGTPDWARGIRWVNEELDTFYDTYKGRSKKVRR